MPVTAWSASARSPDRHRDRNDHSYATLATVNGLIGLVAAGALFAPAHHPAPAQRALTGTLVAEPSTVEPGGTVNFDASSFDDVGVLVLYEWEYGDGTTEETVDDPTVSHMYPAAGVFEAKVTVTDVLDSGSDTVTVTVATPTPTPTPTPEPTPTPTDRNRRRRRRRHRNRHRNRADTGPVPVSHIRHPHTDTDPDADAEPHADTESDRHPHADPHPDAAPHCHAHAEADQAAALRAGDHPPARQARGLPDQGPLPAPLPGGDRPQDRQEDRRPARHPAAQVHPQGQGTGQAEVPLRLRSDVRARPRPEGRADPRQGEAGPATRQDRAPQGPRPRVHLEARAITYGPCVRTRSARRSWPSSRRATTCAGRRARWCRRRRTPPSC